jgi:microcin C transport system permease protein
VQNLIKKDGGWLLFPPIPFSDDTPNYDLNQPARARRRRELAGHRRPGAGRVGAGDFRRAGVDPVALMLTAVSALIGIAAGALQGYYGGWVDLSASACWRSGPGCRCCTC